MIRTVFQPAMAPSEILFVSSTRRLRSACWTTPKPVQVGQAPSGLLKEKWAMLSTSTGAPQCGQGKVSSKSSLLVRARSRRPPGFSFPLSTGRVEGGRDIFPTARAGAVTQAGEQHPQVSVDIRGGTHRGTRAMVGEMLVNADRRGETRDGVDRGLGQSKRDQTRVTQYTGAGLPCAGCRTPGWIFPTRRYPSEPRAGSWESKR